MIYDKDNNMQLCLVATKGDMSKNGIGYRSSVVLFDNKYKREVDNFLKLQLQYDLELFESSAMRKTYNEYRKAMDVLFNLKIFTHKYHARTSWQMEIYDLDELKIHEPYKVEESKLYNDFTKPKAYQFVRYSKNDIKKWLGNRGVYELWSKYKAYRSPSGKVWLFILIDGFVELYDMFCPIFECHEDWDNNGFEWDKNNLVKVIQSNERRLMI